LFSQFSIIRSRALLGLANGYLFTALIVIPHALTFPGAFAPTGLLGAGLQGTAWLYTFWHFGFPAAVLIYAWLKDDPANCLTRTLMLSAIGWSMMIEFSLVCGLTWLATAGDDFLPRLALDSTHIAPLALYTAAINSLISALALALLWIRRRSVLDLWLMVALFAMLIESMSGLLVTSRFSVGFYVFPGFSFVTSIAVLIVFLTEATRFP
jgi:hypothetical protein